MSEKRAEGQKIGPRIEKHPLPLPSHSLCLKCCHIYLLGIEKVEGEGRSDPYLGLVGAYAVRSRLCGGSRRKASARRARVPHHEDPLPPHYGDTRATQPTLPKKGAPSSISQPSSITPDHRMCALQRKQVVPFQRGYTPNGNHQESVQYIKVLVFTRLGGTHLARYPMTLGAPSGSATRPLRHSKCGRSPRPADE